MLEKISVKTLVQALICTWAFEVVGKRFQDNFL